MNYFNKNYLNNLSAIIYVRNSSLNKSKKKKSPSLIKKIRNISSNNKNKSMLDLFPSRNLNCFINNNNKIIYNNTTTYNNNIINNNKKKKSKSFNITHNTINMNKNNVMINLNANIINANTPIQQKLMEYKKYINNKLREFAKKNKKS